MDILKRSLAPLTDAAWEAIDSAVDRVLRTGLCGRRIADVDGPKGWDFSAVGMGRIEIPGRQAREGVVFGVRRVLPLVEPRISFHLDIWEMDDTSRGAEDADVRPAEEAARAMIAFEDGAIFGGLAPGSIKGLLAGSDHKPVPVPLDVKGIIDGVSRALLLLKDASIVGPHTLVLGPKPYRALAGHAPCHPPLRQLEELIGGPVLYSPHLDGGILASTRGGDRTLTLGQDFSIGYEWQETKRVRLFITESFTFRVLEPAAHVVLAAGGARKGR
ncbi:MAG: family 1 encapsulin nanocompartment shell protein [Candidatus Eisenbacteria bacterium]